LYAKDSKKYIRRFMARCEKGKFKKAKNQFPVCFESKDLNVLLFMIFLKIFITCITLIDKRTLSSLNTELRYLTYISV
jgi:hypothetical protein